MNGILSVLLLILVSPMCMYGDNKKSTVEIIEHKSGCYSGEKFGIYVLSEDNEKITLKIIVETPNPCYSAHTYIKDNTVFIDMKRKPDICIQCIGVHEIILNVVNIDNVVVSVEGKEVFKYGKKGY